MSSKRDQLNLPIGNSEAAGLARDQALDQVEESAGSMAIDLAVEAVRNFCKWKYEFTSDDVRETYGDFGFHEPRAWGAVMMKAKRMGICVPTKQYRNSARRSSHKRPMRVWRRK